MIKKDNFANNEAMKMIMEAKSGSVLTRKPNMKSEKQVLSEHGNPPAGYKLNPLYIETKSRRLQLLIQPSLYDKIKTNAEANQTSINELVNLILQKALTE